jgi:hypothetical protein
MKIIFLIAMMMYSLSAFSARNEVECHGQTINAIFSVNIEQSFPPGSYFKRAQLTVIENGTPQTDYFEVSGRVMPGQGRVTYMADEFKIQVDLWPDWRPHWSSTYVGSLLGSAFGNHYVQRLYCRFPNAF